MRFTWRTLEFVSVIENKKKKKSKVKTQRLKLLIIWLETAYLHSVTKSSNRKIQILAAFQLTSAILLLFPWWIIFAKFLFYVNIFAFACLSCCSAFGFFFEFSAYSLPSPFFISSLTTLFHGLFHFSFFSGFGF